MEAGVGGEAYDIIKTTYADMKCAVKISDMEADVFLQSGGVEQGCSLSSTLFNVSIGELAKSLELSDTPGLSLCDTQIKCLLSAGELMWLAPSQEALQRRQRVWIQMCPHYEQSLKTLSLWNFEIKK